jgi:hypothetical protein
MKNVSLFLISKSQMVEIPVVDRRVKLGVRRVDEGRVDGEREESGRLDAARESSFCCCLMIHCVALEPDLFVVVSVGSVGSVGSVAGLLQCQRQKSA